MGSGERYSIEIGSMDQQERDLLECLLRISQGDPLDGRAEPLVDRLVRAGLVDVREGERVLTSAGILRCQSLQHRQASDAEAAHVLWDRQHAGGAHEPDGC